LAGGLVLQAAPAGRKVRPPANYVQFGTPDQEAGARAWREFRGLGIAGDYYIEFQVRVMPRRGEEREVSGQLWGTRNENGPIQRVWLGGAETSRMLIQNGPKPSLWLAQGAEAAARPVTDDRVPLVPDADITLFDLQMPFLYWEDFVFEGVSRIRGRPAHTFLLYPPADYGDEGSELAGVRVHLDTQFKALVQTELIGADGKAYKTMSVLDLKKAGEQWMVKTIDWRDDRTRNKTRMQIAGVAFNQEFSPVIFEPGQLGLPLRAPEDVIALGR
jgi:hypothetical protein